MTGAMGTQQITRHIGNLSALGLGCRRSDRLVFTGVEFRIESGDALLVVGANGSGKSSLLRIMAGLLPPAAGVLFWSGSEITDDASAHRERVAYLGHGDAIKPSLTVAEEIRFWTLLNRSDEKTGEAALTAMGLGKLLHFSCRHLSAGQKRRLAIARVLAHIGAPLWILDEPTNGLDEEARKRLASALSAHREGGGMVVVASHDGIDLPGAKILELGPHAAEARAAEIRGLEVDQLI
jgi:heme exporter protein A